MSAAVIAEAAEQQRRENLRTSLSVGLIGIMTVIGIAFLVQRQSNDPWDPRLEPYVSFVETTRGLEFDHSVAVRQADVGAELRQSDAEIGDGSAEEVSNAESIAFTLLGLLEPAGEDVIDLAEATADVRADSAAAYYDPVEREIVLPEGAIDPWLASVIVHELTHALQHQHRLLDFQPATADEATMQLALIEGDADRIEAAWINAQDEATREAIWAVNADAAAEAQSSSFLDAVFATPYILGDPAVELIVATHGTKRLDDLLRNGPGSSELLIDPLSATPRPTKAVDRLIPDPSGSDVLGGGTLGPVVLYQLLAPALGPEEALLAVEGYDFDDYLVYDSAGQTCVNVTVWTDNGDDNDVLAAGFDRAGFTPDAAERGEPKAPSVEVVVCDGETVGDPAAQTVDLLYPASTSAWLLGEGLHPDDDIARCIAYRTADQATNDGGTVLTWEQVERLTTAITAECENGWG